MSRGSLKKILAEPRPVDKLNFLNTIPVEYTYCFKRNRYRNAKGQFAKTNMPSFQTFLKPGQKPKRAKGLRKFPITAMKKGDLRYRGKSFFRPNCFGDSWPNVIRRIKLSLSDDSDRMHVVQYKNIEAKRRSKHVPNVHRRSIRQQLLAR